MKKLFKNGYVVNVFLDQVLKEDVLIEDDRIIGFGSYDDSDADETEDLDGRYICPGFIDGHIHIESTMLSPAEFVRVCLPHGTTTVIADPHEIANASGTQGIRYMLESTQNMPMDVYFMIPSCVPATQFDETGAVLGSKDVAAILKHPRVLGLGEMMNYPGVLFDDKEVVAKIRATHKEGKIINGHAPLLSGRELDKYIAAGIFDDHESTNITEAMEKLKKGQWIFIRQGTAARDLENLLPLFEEPYSHRCIFATDDKHPADLLNDGHIDNIIRTAVEMGQSVVTAIRMATLQAALRYNLKNLGAVAPGYIADLLILDDLNTVKVRDVYFRGKRVAANGEALPFEKKYAGSETWRAVHHSFWLDPVSKEKFHIEPKGDTCRVIRVIPKQLLTKEEIMKIDFTKGNGIDVSKDILKLAVIERYMNSGHMGLGYITGMKVKEGAIASSVSHDSHNLIVVGAGEEDMAVAANCVREMNGGAAVVKNGKVMASVALPISGLMGEKSAAEMVEENAKLRAAANEISHAEGVDALMNLAFVSLPVIPDLKMTTRGLVNVNEQKLVPLFVD